jgi:hypothetical protein
VPIEEEEEDLCALRQLQVSLGGISCILGRNCAFFMAIK